MPVALMLISCTNSDRDAIPAEFFSSGCWFLELLTELADPIVMPKTEGNSSPIRSRFT